MMADRLLESPLHAARFVSLIPFHRMEAPGAEKVEVWHSMQSFLSRVSCFYSLKFCLLNLLIVSDNRVVEIQKIMQCFYVTYCLDSALMPSLLSERIVKALTPGS